MPGRSCPIHRSHLLVLPVTVMVGIVAPAVAEVNATDKSNVAFGSSGVADDDEFLVMGAAESHALVEQDLPSGRVDLLPEVSVLLGAETKSVHVRPPEQSLYQH